MITIDGDVILLIFLALAVGLFLILWLKSTLSLKKLKTRFAPVLSIEDEAKRLRKETDELQQKTEDVRSTYKEKRKRLEELEQEVAIYDERISFAEFGIYEPHFDYGDSETYKRKIKEVRNLQKKKVSDKTATFCPADWTVGGSRSKGNVLPP